MGWHGVAWCGSTRYEQQRSAAAKEAGNDDVLAGVDAGMDEEKCAFNIEADASGRGRLPPPFEGRPGPGARAIMTRLLTEMVPVLTSELCSWTVDGRLHATRMLRNLLVFVEDSATGSLDKIVAPLALACADEDAAVADAAQDCARLVGYFVSATALFEQTLPRITGPQSDQSGEASRRCKARKAQRPLGWDPKSPGQDDDEAANGKGPLSGSQKTCMLVFVASALRGMRSTDVVPHLSAVASCLAHPTVCR